MIGVVEVYFIARVELFYFYSIFIELFQQSTLGWVNFCEIMIFSHIRVNWMSIKKNSVEIAQIDLNPGQEASYNILINYLYFTFELCCYWCNTNVRTFDW